MKPIRLAATAALFAGFGLLGLTAAPIPKAGKLPPPTEEELKQSENNLKQIMIAVHSHHDVYGALPNSVTDADGKPLLSWRVHLLPYLEEGALYQKFKLDEAWDGETNKPLIESIPKVFAPVRVKPKDAGVTFYRGFTGADALFEAGNKKITLVGITDGCSNTVAVVEAGEPCVWTKPDDLPFDAKKELPKLGGQFDGDFFCAMCDGSVRFVSKEFKPAEFKKAITRNGGEVVSDEEAFPKPEAK